MQEIPILPWWVPVFLTIWGVVGPIAGLVVGHYLSVSSERRRWLADNQKEEYRKLLAALTRVNLTICGLGGGQTNLEDTYHALKEVSEASGSCLFINEFLEQSKVLGDVHEATQLLVGGGKFDDYQTKYWAAIHKIIDAAKKIRA